MPLNQFQKFPSAIAYQSTYLHPVSNLPLVLQAQVSYKPFNLKFTFILKGFFSSVIKYFLKVAFNFSKAVRVAAQPTFSSFFQLFSKVSHTF